MYSKLVTKLSIPAVCVRTKNNQSYYNYYIMIFKSAFILNHLGTLLTRIILTCAYAGEADLNLN